MIQQDPKDKTPKKEQEDSSIQPDPETLGPDPEEHMKGPISTIIRKMGEKAEEMAEEDAEEKEKKEREDKEHD